MRSFTLLFTRFACEIYFVWDHQIFLLNISRPSSDLALNDDGRAEWNLGKSVKKIKCIQISFLNDYHILKKQICRMMFQDLLYTEISSLNVRYQSSYELYPWNYVHPKNICNLRIKYVPRLRKYIAWCVIEILYKLLTFFCLSVKTIALLNVLVIIDN